MLLQLSSSLSMYHVIRYDKYAGSKRRDENWLLFWYWYLYPPHLKCISLELNAKTRSKRKKFRLPNARYVKLDNYVYLLNDIMYSVCFAMPTESEKKVFFCFSLSYLGLGTSNVVHRPSNAADHSVTTKCYCSFIFTASLFHTIFNIQYGVHEKKNENKTTTSQYLEIYAMHCSISTIAFC